MRKKTPNAALSKLVTEATIEALQTSKDFTCAVMRRMLPARVGEGAVLLGISRVDNDKTGTGSVV